MDHDLVAEVRAAGVRLVAVTKGQPVGAALEAVAAGVVDLGENYARDLLDKARQVPGARWHYLGAVQRRKVRSLAPHVAVWQSVARAEEGEAIAGATPGATVLVQVNVSGLPARNGCHWDELDALVAALRTHDLDVQGLMCVATPGEERAQFRRLAAAAASLGLRELSMGMSGDWRVAVEEGATTVRLGSALFGPRPDPLDLRR
ncbi:MAG TPA: alanine racemase [Acidimicrobiales bacterium]|nr:alanine racemase [Acidimicrobiales bacterium]